MTAAEDSFDPLSDQAAIRDTIPVHISYEIIRLFSEGLYQRYVLAWHLTHVSQVNGRILCTSMNFRLLRGAAPVRGQRAVPDRPLRSSTGGPTASSCGSGVVW
jgi:hypothetical protein